MPSRAYFRLPVVYCIVLNWNGWQDTIKCLASLDSQDYPALHVIVVDNYSTNDSVAHISAEFPDVPLIQSSENGGFAKGNNIGIRHAVLAGADFVWLLNNDTVAPPDTASKLVSKALSSQRIAAVGSVLYWLKDPSKVQAWGGGSIDLWSGYNTHFVRPTHMGAGTFLTGASILLRTEALLQIGLLDESFFLYSEDTDLSIRLQRAGWMLAVAEDTAVLHKGNASSSIDRLRSDKYSTESGIRLLRKHSAVPQISVGIYLALRFANRLRRGEVGHFVVVLKGLSHRRGAPHEVAGRNHAS
jgi:GT2 family glycosyltransferase